MKLEVETLLAHLREGGVVSESGNREVFVQVLAEADALLDAITASRIGDCDDAPRLHLRRAAEKLKKLADRETEAWRYCSLVSK